MDEPHTRSQEEQAPQITQTRKRQIDSDSDDEPVVKRIRLTRKNLALFDKIGKKKVSDSTDESGSTKTTSTTLSGFAIQARKNGILEPGYSKPPKNLEDIHKRHAQSRATASPPESAYNDYIDRVEEAKNEATMVIEASELLKKIPQGLQRVFNQAFTGFPKDVGVNRGLSAPQPDFIEGLKMRDYLPFPVDEHVDGAAIYKDDPYFLSLPHLAGEWKDTDGSMRTAELQSAYDGAAMVYARNQALAYMGKADPPGHAEITTFTTDGTNLNLYAHYAIPLEEDENTLEYHQYQYATANVKDTYQGHKDGKRSLRNAQDHAKTQSEAMRDQLKEHWKQRRHRPTAKGAPLPTSDLEPPVTTNPHEEAAPFGETAPYEDEDGYEIIEQPCQPTSFSGRML